MAKQAKGQLKEKVVIGVAVVIGVVIRTVITIGEEVMKEDKKEIQDKEVLDALFNKII